MTTLIKRNDILEEIRRYWNSCYNSNIGLGRLKRELVEGVYLISKQYGRNDLALFNVNESITINGEVVETRGSDHQYSLETDGVTYRTGTQECVKSYIRNWVASNKKEICKQLHFLDWFERQTIVNMRYDDVVALLQSYTYNETDAVFLFNNLSI